MDSILIDKIRRAHSLAKERGVRLAIAESCTGGLVAHLITNEPGASEILAGGVVAYSPEAKTTLLHINPEALARYGTISNETAIAMAEAVRAALRTEIGLGITGVLGPSSTEGKPVGRVHMAVASKMGVTVIEMDFTGARAEVKAAAAGAAIDLLIDELSSWA